MTTHPYEPDNNPDDIDLDAPGNLAAASEKTRRALADHLLLETLLDQTLRPDPSAIDRKMDRVLRALGPTTTIPTRAHRRALPTWIYSTISLAFGLLLALSVGLFGSSATIPTAEAAVALALKETERADFDRHYHLNIDLLALPKLEADLYLRGNDQFALHFEGPLELTAWLGTNGQEAWVVPSIGPIVVARDIADAQKRLTKLSNLPFPLLNITNVLKALESDYTLELRPDQTLPTAGNEITCRHVVATLRAGFRPLLPQRVEFWVEPDAGIVHRLHLDWNRRVEGIAVRHITFELVGSATRPETWYSHNAHHDPNQPVLKLSPPSPTSPNQDEADSTKPTE